MSVGGSGLVWSFVGGTNTEDGMEAIVVAGRLCVVAVMAARGRRQPPVFGFRLTSYWLSWPHTPDTSDQSGLLMQVTGWAVAGDGGRGRQPPRAKDPDWCGEGGVCVWANGATNKCAKPTGLMRFPPRQSETGILAYGEIYTSLGQHGVCSASNEIVHPRPVYAYPVVDAKKQKVT
jgi:hypothetical protein